MIRISGLAAIALAASVVTTVPVRADADDYNGHWRGVEATRGSGTAPFVTIVDLDVAQVPPRTIKDPVTFSVSLRVYLNHGIRGVRTPPPRPPGSLPAEDRRPTLVPEPPLSLTGVAALGSDPEGEFLRITVRPSPPPGIPAPGPCGFNVSVTTSGKRLYYQVVPQRTRCDGGRFAGMSTSRGYLTR
jgi:hypothetical protein